VHPKLHAHEVLPSETRRSGSTQPYGSSYFLPGKFASNAATFLLDTGCTTNLLSWRPFDTLNARDREHSTFADGSCIPFYGVIEPTGRVRDHVISETFMVSQLKEDAILGMSFLTRHKCHTDFNKSSVMSAGRELACVDKFEEPFGGNMQVVRR